MKSGKAFATESSSNLPADHLGRKIRFMIFNLFFVTSIAGKDATAAGKAEPPEALLVMLTRPRLWQRIALADTQ